MNSPVTGGWEDYVAVDVVRCVEARYRVRRDRASRGVAIDIGVHDRLAWVPRGARRLSELLTAAGIAHTLTEHDGGHDDRLGERIERVMLPFFSRVFSDTSDGSGS